ncbi:MAG TPA: ribonuclease E inhibitor RraB, partial [Terracidiphilus sp.]
MPATFPQDANGDVLRRLQSHGDDLTKPRDIDFTVVFPDESAAQSFADDVRKLGYKVDVEHADVK